jgi:hypothetical protein
VLPLVYVERKVTSVKHTAAGTGKGTQCLRERETTEGFGIPNPPVVSLSRREGGREGYSYQLCACVIDSRHTDVCVCLPNMFAADYSDEFWQAKGTTPVDLVHKDT